MAKVIPTDRWSAIKIFVPGVGVVMRQVRKQSVEVPDAAVHYLTSNFLAKVDSEGNPEKSPGSTELGNALEKKLGPIAIDTRKAPTPSEDTAGAAGAEAGDLLADLVTEFFNEAETPKLIADAIKGIGEKTAEELIANRPLDWQKIQEILSDRQLAAVRKWAATPEPSTESSK